jgi:hypothetical protein
VQGAGCRVQGLGRKMWGEDLGFRVHVHVEGGMR